MMERLVARGRMLAERRARVVCEELAARIVVPGVSVSVTDDGVELRGRGLRVRALVEPGLRWIGGMLR